jgi:hypothetical protein
VIRLVLIALVLGLVGTGVIWVLERRRLERVAHIRAAFLALKLDPPGPQTALKDVCVRNAIVRFCVPEGWAEEYPDETRARFYDRKGSHRMLEVTGTTIPTSTASLADTLRARASGPTTLETLSSGSLLVKSLGAARDGSVDVVRFTWVVGRPLSPERAQVASFTLSVPFASALDVLTRNEVVRMEHAVRAAELGRA